MPNWCSNTISIYGSKEKMKPIVDKLREIEDTNDPIMESLIGMPDKPSNYVTNGWWNYNLNRFGTKWDVRVGDIPNLIIEDDNVLFDFDTAWSPPIEFLQNLCKMYKVRAKIEYAESGCDFAGVALINIKGAIFDRCMSYLEGIYHFFDYFWEEVDNTAEWACDEETLEEFMERFIFITDEKHLEEIKETFNNHIEMKKSFD